MLLLGTVDVESMLGVLGLDSGLFVVAAVVNVVAICMPSSVDVLAVLDVDDLSVKVALPVIVLADDGSVLEVLSKVVGGAVVRLGKAEVDDASSSVADAAGIVDVVDVLVAPLALVLSASVVVVVINADDNAVASEGERAAAEDVDVGFRSGCVEPVDTGVPVGCVPKVDLLFELPCVPTGFDVEEVDSSGVSGVSYTPFTSETETVSAGIPLIRPISDSRRHKKESSGASIITPSQGKLLSHNKRHWLTLATDSLRISKSVPLAEEN